MTNTITLDIDDGNALKELAAAYPGVTLHLAHLAVFRIGLTLAVGDPALLAGELASIGEERRERRRHGRIARIDGVAAVDDDGREGGCNG